MAVVILAVLAAVLVLIFLHPRRGSKPVPSSVRPALSPPVATQKRGAAAHRASTAKPAAVPVAGSAESGGEFPGVQVPKDAQGIAAETAANAAKQTWKAQPVADFTPADLERVGEGVQVNLGDYRVAPNEAFDILIRLSGPPLESATIMLSYDPDMLSVIPDGARPVGKFFRRGIECYVDEKGGRVVLIHRGPPGKKNINGAVGKPVLALRVRAGENEGDTMIALAPGSSFTSGRGGDEKFSTYGGTIHIRR